MDLDMKSNPKCQCGAVSVIVAETRYMCARCWLKEQHRYKYSKPPTFFQHDFLQRHRTMKFYKDWGEKENEG